MWTSWGARAGLYAGALLFLATLATAAPADYADELVERARQARLHERPEWRTLVHYKESLFGDGSLIDDPNFFAAGDGKENPQAELEATIRSFFEPVPEGGKHPVCRFVARFDWLKEQLSIDVSRLPVSECKPFEQILARVSPKQVIVAFPTAFMNSPASMYGHTLLIIDNVHDSEMLSFAVNYAGETDTTFGPIYAVKGIFGFYKGYYEILPYYAKLQEYNDVNDRDIWEYRLNLDAEEMRRLVMHVYELENIYSDYYFFDENCSYNLLFLLDVARPGLDLTDQKGLWVIPLDTVREISRSGLVDSIAYRPSKSTKIQHIASQLGDEEQEAALAIAAGKIDPGDWVGSRSAPSEPALVCDLASEYLQYQYYERRLSKEEYAGRFRRILEVRSGLGEAPPGALRPPQPPTPDGGHRSARSSLGGGVLDDDGFAQLRLRPVYHDLLDNPRGYEPGSQIIFVEADLRYYPRREDLELERLTFIDILSLSPRNRFFSPRSWKVDTGLVRRLTAGGQRALVYDLSWGLGHTYSNRVTDLLYLLPEGDLQLGGALEGGYSVGFGASAGVTKRLGRRWQAHLFAREIYYVWGEGNDVFRMGLDQNVEIAPNVSLRGTVTLADERNRSWWEWSARLNLFH